MKRVFQILLLLACFGWLVSCGAFADVFEEPDGAPTLKIDPDPVIRQGRQRQLTITFLEDPPWAGTPGAKGYITECNPGEDIGCTFKYDGVKTVEATLQAHQDAKIGTRTLRVRAAYEKSGRKQQTHSGWTWLLVMPIGTSDGGVRGGD
jgi:hypothetical protein